MFVSALEVVKDIGPIITAAGVFVAAWALRLNHETLKANHDWNRRQYTAALLAAWNEKTSAHRKAIEKLRPGLLDADTKGEAVELTNAEARRIYTAKPDSPEWELRFHFIELLNYFEAIASAYHNSVGDKRMIEESFESVLTRFHGILANFMVLVAEQRAYDPWGPYTTVVNHWKARRYKPPPPTA